MPETILLCTLAFLMLAATARSFRQAASVRSHRTVTTLRLAAAALFVAAAMAAGTDLAGERWVRLIGAASIAAGGITLLLSAAPRATLAPLRWLSERRVR